MTTLNSVLVDGRRTRYDAISRILHWLTLLLLSAQFALGWLMPDADSVKTPQGLAAWHVGVGTLLLAVVIVRLMWAAIRRSPADVQQSAVLRFAAKTLHRLLYALLLAVPLLGWLNASGRDWAVRLAGVAPLPRLATPDSLGATIGDWHSTSAIVLLALIGLHVVAAITHQIGFKDQTIRRML
jgi:cytochrome b561